MKRYTKIIYLILICFYSNINAQSLSINDVQDRYLCENRAIIVYFQTDIEINSETTPFIIMSSASGIITELKAEIKQNAMSATVPAGIAPGLYNIKILFKNLSVSSVIFGEPLEVIDSKYQPSVSMTTKSVVLSQIDRIPLNFLTSKIEYPLDLILNADAKTAVHIPQSQTNLEKIVVPEHTTFYEIQTVYIGACEYKQAKGTGITEVIIKTASDEIKIDSSFSTFENGMQIIKMPFIGTKIDLHGVFDYGNGFVVRFFNETQTTVIDKVDVERPYTTPDFIFFNIPDTVILYNKEKIYFRIEDINRPEAKSIMIGPISLNDNITIIGG